MKKKILRLAQYHNIFLPKTQYTVEQGFDGKEYAVKLYKDDLLEEVRVSVNSVSNSRDRYTIAENLYPSDLGILWDGEKYFINELEESEKAEDKSDKIFKYAYSTPVSWARLNSSAPTVNIISPPAQELTANEYLEIDTDEDEEDGA